MNQQSYSGTVQEGTKRASALGFPTINIPLHNAELSGIYAGVVTHEDREYHAAIFGDSVRGVLEAYLIDFDEDLYGKEITITLLHKLRESQTFSDEESLKKQIGEDVEKVIHFFNR